jgi:hypothetical protein
MRVLRENNQLVTTSLDRLTNQVSDLAVQIGNQSQSIGRLEKAITDLTQESKTQLEIAQLQTQNVAELVKIVQQLAIARG